MSALTNTFFLTYVVLFTTGTITFIESIRTANSAIRHILNLETCISIVAVFFYTQFMKMIQTNNINFAEITRLRYVDWSITTPMMILALTLVLSFNSKQRVSLQNYILLILLNYGMLSMGYLGESGRMDKVKASIAGFVFFFAMFAFIWVLFLMNSKSMNSLVVYSLYFVVWAIYGIVYFFNEKNKNISYNVLDLIAKGLIGIGLWTYLADVIDY
jgi:bacteriorhodopsin